MGEGASHVEQRDWWFRRRNSICRCLQAAEKLGGRKKRTAMCLERQEGSRRC